MAPTQECIYFKKDGYCAKGQYCTFLHVTIKKAVAAQSKGPPTTSSSSKSAIAPTPAVTSARKGHNPADELWNHCDDIADSDYCGFASKQNVTRTMRYSTITRLNIRDDDSSHNYTNSSNSTSSSFDNTKRTICHFYQLGSCRFGSFCRNSHENTSNNNNNNNNNGSENTIGDELVKSSATDEAELSSYECGICMENPMVTKSKSFGILSNCDCVFCLDCIRNWRKDGLTVAKKTEQVR